MTSFPRLPQLRFKPLHRLHRIRIILEFFPQSGKNLQPPPIAEPQPALATYVDEQLENLADEDPAFGPEERAQVEKVLAAAVAALTRAVRQPS